MIFDFIKPGIVFVKIVLIFFASTLNPIGVDSRPQILSSMREAMTRAKRYSVATRRNAIAMSVMIFTKAIGDESSAEILRHVVSAKTSVKNGMMLIKRIKALCTDHLALRQNEPATKKNAGMRIEQNPYTEISMLPS